MPPRYIAVTILLYIYIICPLRSQISINEFVASNFNTISDEAGEFDDWVELFNNSNQSIDIAGMYLSDDLNNKKLWRISNEAPEVTTIPAGGFLILWFDKDVDDGPLHVGAKLSAGGDNIILTASDGLTIIDFHTYGPQITDISEGREIDGEEKFVSFSMTTPGESNAGAKQTIQSPEFSINGGHYQDSVLVELGSLSDNEVVYYTTNGSTPDTLSNQYTDPITIKNTTSLRAISLNKDGGRSRVATQTYLIDVNHTFPIIALASNPSSFFDPSFGIFGNTSEDIEIIVNAEFYETDGTLGFNNLVEAELNGSASVANNQKSIALKAKRSIGSSSFNHPIFPDIDKDTYRSLVLRNSGQDWPITGFRDAAVSSLVRDLNDMEDIILPPRLLTQGYRPSICYLNGEYWGIYNIRERIDKRYVDNHFDLDDEEIDFIHNREIVKVGDIENWRNFMHFLNERDFSDSSNFADLAVWLDTEAYMDYMIFNLYIDNQDWPGNNYRRFRERRDIAQWQFFTYDLDFSFGVFTNQGVNTGYAGINTLDGNYNIPNIKIYPYNEWGTRVFRSLAENEQWRHAFFNRTSDQLNTIFKTERVVDRIDEFLELYVPEMDQHIDKWNVPQDQVGSANRMKDFAEKRVDIFRNHFIEVFDDITETAKITLSTEPNQVGTINFNTLTIDEQDDITAWEGLYFQDIEIPVKAIPKPGYLFEGWSGTTSSRDSEISIILRERSNTLVANFVQGDTSQMPIIINEINYHSDADNNQGDWVELYNPSNQTVNISGWYVQDEAGNYFNIPNNTVIEPRSFLVMAEDETLFDYDVNLLVGSFGKKSPYKEMKLSNDGERITLYNAAGFMIDVVDYDDEGPWPNRADGQGYSLQLTEPSLDNSVPDNWEAWMPTAGAVNGFTSGNTFVSDDDDLRISPNPLTKNSCLYITATGVENYQGMDFTMYDLLGREVNSTSMTNDRNGKYLELKIGNLPQGIYILSLVLKNNKRISRFVTIF